jgi:alpha-tubulin suppressor-like RCC1 family protein
MATRQLRRLAVLFALLATAALAAACDSSTNCETDGDCFAGEVCYEGNCSPDPGGNNGNNGNGHDGGGGDGGGNGPQVVEVSAGGLSTCARLASGEIRCWGRNLNGELGNGETSNGESTPVPVLGFTDATRLESGHSNHCAFGADGRVYCWGSNGSEQVTPDENVSSITQPTDIGAASIADIGLSDDAICVMLEDEGGINCLGSESDPVVYGLPTFPDPVASISGGFHHGCAVLETGEVLCWGSENSGEAAREDIVDNIPSIAKVAPGNEHTCALSDSGTVYCWGSNDSGQLGVGSNQRPDGPVAVEGLDRIVDIDAGFSHTCALDADGAVVCWGNDTGGFFQPLPTGIFGLNEGVEMISVGSYHACALQAGKVLCWGRGDEGQLGNGDESSSSRPVQVGF